LFAARLLRMYERYCRKTGWTFELLDAKDDGQGLRQATFQISGKGVSVLHGEAGAHSIQHITKSRKKDRIHTSNASIAVFDLSELSSSSLTVPDSDIRFDTFRGSGAGGQHRNVTDSAVRALHIPSGEMVTITSGRSQGQNRQLARQLLMAKLADKAQSGHAQQVQSRRSVQSKAGRGHQTRVYDMITDMVRCQRSGKKVRRADKVLDGDMSQLLG
jgi:peptide chain release factor 1